MAARDQLQSDIMIIARTDAKQTYGFDEAMERLNQAVKIGVDAVFFEALASEEEARKVCEVMRETNTPVGTLSEICLLAVYELELMPKQVLLNMVPRGVTPNFTAQQARDVGFRIMIVPGVAIGPVIRSVTAELEHLKKEGTVSQENDREGVVKGFNICGLQECIEIDQKAGGKAYDSVGKS